MTRVAILNSRQSKTPAGDDPWVKQTLAAVAMAAAEGWTIVSSVGLNTWELVTWATGRSAAALELAIPESLTGPESADLLQRFGLSGTNTEFIPVEQSNAHRSRESWWQSRDGVVLSRAEVLIPVSIRRGGGLEQLIADTGRAVLDNRFRVPYAPAHHHLESIGNATSINPALAAWGDQYLIHWTRACHGPWPGETEREYYDALVTSGDSYCHSGFATLGRILGERRLRGSSWRIGTNARMVPMTALTPKESLALMRWRPRRSQWSFEPYGIAIERNAAEQCGAVPVRYVQDEEWHRLRESDKPICHRIGSGEMYWPDEQEWRIAEELDLSQVPVSALRVIMKTEVECDQLRHSTPFDVHSMFV